MSQEQDKKIFPSKHDQDLKDLAVKHLMDQYPGRAMPDHAAWAFEAACDELDDYISLKKFLRLVVRKWMWERPSLPRGVSGLQSWREIKPVIYEDDDE